MLGAAPLGSAPLAGSGAPAAPAAPSTYTFALTPGVLTLQSPGGGATFYYRHYTYGFTLSPGAFALSGVADSGITHTPYVMPLTPGVIRLTGVAANLHDSVTRMALDVGVFTVSGATEVDAPTYPVTLDVGVIALTGIPATFPNASGRFILALTPPAMVVRRVVQLVPGVIAFTGTPVGIAPVFDEPADIGSFAVTGQPVTFKATRALGLDPGALTIVGRPSTVVQSHIIDLDPGSLTIAGNPIERGYGIAQIVGAITLAGQPASLAFDHVVDLVPGALTLTGAGVGTLCVHKMFAQPGTYSINTNPTAAYNRKLAPVPGHYNILGPDDQIATIRQIALAAGRLTFTPVQPRGARDRQVFLSPGMFRLAGVDENASVVASLSLDPGAFTLSGQGFGQTNDRVVALAPGAFAYFGRDIAVTYSGNYSGISEGTRWRIVVSTDIADDIAATSALRWDMDCTIELDSFTAGSPGIDYYSAEASA